MYKQKAFSYPTLNLEACGLKHLGTRTIETERLILRRFRIEDAQSMYENWASDPEVNKFLSWPFHQSVDVIKEVIENWIKSYSELDNYQWAKR